MGGVEHEVIGISTDLREQSLREAALPTVLVAQAQTLQAAVDRWFGAHLLIRAAPGTPLAPALRQTLAGLDGQAVLQQLQPLAAPHCWPAASPICSTAAARWCQPASGWRWPRSSASRCSLD